MKYLGLMAICSFTFVLAGCPEPTDKSMVTKADVGVPDVADMPDTTPLMKRDAAPKFDMGPKLDMAATTTDTAAADGPGGNLDTAMNLDVAAPTDGPEVKLDTAAPTDMGAADTTAPKLDAAATPTFAQVFTMLRANCDTCHTTDNPAKGSFNISNVSDTMIYASRLFTACIGTGCTGMGKMRVVKNNLANSMLYQKIIDSPTKCGGKMPAGGAAMLSQANIDLVKNWIMGGAPGP
jgi:hypothetical protein